MKTFWKKNSQICFERLSFCIKNSRSGRELIRSNYYRGTMESIHVPGQQPVDPYNSLIGASVVDRDGNRGNIRSITRHGDTTMAVLAREDGGTIDMELAALERHGDSFFTSHLLDRRKNVHSPTSSPASTASTQWHEEVKIPLMQEEINIDQHRVDTGKGVRVKKHVLEHEEIVDVPHAEEVLSVEHIEVGKIVPEGSLPQARQEGDTYIIPVFEEVYVVEKKIRLKEEVHIKRERKTSKENQKIRLRSEQALIEHFDENAAPD
jgi:stress response protein YsnF